MKGNQQKIFSISFDLFTSSFCYAFLLCCYIPAYTFHLSFTISTSTFTLLHLALHSSFDDVGDGDDGDGPHTATAPLTPTSTTTTTSHTYTHTCLLAHGYVATPHSRCYLLRSPHCRTFVAFAAVVSRHAHLRLFTCGAFLLRLIVRTRLCVLFHCARARVFCALPFPRTIRYPRSLRRTSRIARSPRWVSSGMPLLGGAYLPFYGITPASGNISSRLGICCCLATPRLAHMRLPSRMPAYDIAPLCGWSCARALRASMPVALPHRVGMRFHAA